MREETGVEVEIEGLIGEIKYWFSRPQEGVRYYKTVRHYLLRPVGGDPSLHDHEFDDVRWLPASKRLEAANLPKRSRGSCARRSIWSRASGGGRRDDRSRWRAGPRRTIVLRAKTLADAEQD